MARKRDEQRAEARRHEILDAASRCFVAKGVHLTGMRDICREVKLSAGAVYNYFDSKEAIIEGLAQRERGEIDALADFLAASGGKPNAIAKAVRYIVQDYDRESARLAVELQCEASRNPAVQAAMAENDRVLHEVLMKAVAEGQERAHLDRKASAEKVMQTLVALYEGFIGMIAQENGKSGRYYGQLAEAAVQALLQRN